MTGFSLIVSPLSKDHDKAHFSSGEKTLDNYLKKQAKQDIKRRISRVFVATEANAPSIVLGFYTLSSVSIHLDQLPEAIARKLPRHPIPAALIGRLAVSEKHQGQGVGKLLLADAIKRTQGVSDDIAIYAMVVDALSEQAEAFYQQYGFVSLSGEHRRLYLPLKSIHP